MCVLMPSVHSKHSTCGLECRFCGILDTHPDPLDPNYTIAWAVVVEGKTQGRVCYYCIRVFNGLYKTKDWLVSTLSKHLGENSEEHTQFMAYRDHAIQKFKEQGTHINVQWPYTYSYFIFFKDIYI